MAHFEQKNRAFELFWLPISSNLKIYDVICPENVTLRIWKWCHRVPWRISNGIGYCGSSRKSGSNGLKVLKCVVSVQNGPKITILRHYNVISPENLNLRIWKWFHWVPSWISYVIGYYISVKRSSNRLKCLISDQNGPRMTILCNYDVISPEKRHFENFKMVPLGSLVNFLWYRVWY